MSAKNPKIDLIFKKLFGSEENKDLLMSLINSILPAHQQIASLVLKNTYNVSDYSQGKLSIFDIKAEDENGVLYDIEMQLRGSEFYGRRTLYYWAKMFGSQLDYIHEMSTATEQDEETERLEKLEKAKKVGYSGLKKCIVISLLDFNYFEDKKYTRFFTLKDNESNETHDDLDYLNLYFIELKKFKGKLQPVQTMLERWITFLNNAYLYNQQNLPKELAEIKEIRKATQKLNTMYLDEKEKREYEGQHKFWLDQTSILNELIEKKEIAEKKVEEAKLKEAQAKLNESEAKLKEAEAKLKAEQAEKKAEQAKKKNRRG